jgi:pyrimidine deaminase RibD-like protein
VPEPDPELMKEVIKIALNSKPEDENVHPVVGVIIAKGGRTLAKAWRGEFEPGEHAEFTTFWHHLREKNLEGATLYTTLEPCTRRKHPKLACAEWIISRKIGSVVIGMLDPDPRICGRGVWKLREAGIKVYFFPPEFMAQVERANSSFIALHEPTRHAAEVHPVGTEIEHLQAEEEIVQQYCSQHDFPEHCYIAGKWEQNRCFLSLPDSVKKSVLQTIRRKSAQKLDRVRRDIFVIKALDSAGQPNLLFYFSGRPQTGWHTWLLPSRKRDFEQNLTERLRYHAVDISVFLNIRARDVGVEYAPKLPLSVCLKVNRYATDPKDQTNPRIYVFRYCFVRIRNPKPAILKPEFSLNISGYERKFKWLHPEALEHYDDIWNADADVVRTIHRAFETMLTKVPDSLAEKRLAF